MNQLNELQSSMDEVMKDGSLKTQKLVKFLEKKLEKTLKRLDRIINQSDRQQLSLINLNNTITFQSEKLDKLHKYDIQQQIIAREKLDSAIVDDLKNSTLFSSKTIYKPADILSGDFYSTHTLKDGSVFVYIIDGQGHGISPALTVFAVSSTISHLVDEDISFEKIIEKLFPIIQKFLGEIEQLSFTMIGLSSNKKNISYVSGGMYPFIIKTGEKILKYKPNNLPFMNFSPTPKIDSIIIDNWDDIIIYTDGLVEDLTEDMEEFSPLNILSSSSVFNTVKKKLESGKFEDDITVVQITNIK